VEPRDPLPRIAVVNDVAGVGSIQARVLREAGYTVDFIDVPKPGATLPLYAKILILPLRLAGYVPIIRRLRRTPYAWLHIHFLSYGFLGVLAGKPFYLHAHGHDAHTNLRRPLIGWLSRFAMRRARAIFYVTPDLARFLGDFGDRSYLLPNPLEPSFFEGVTAPTRLEKLLLFTRLYPIKAPEVAFAATPELSKLASLAAVAWGPLTDRFREKYGRFVEFHERVPHEEMPAVIDRFDAVIGQMRLGILSLSELEAMARGRVVFMRLDTSLYPDDTPPVANVDDAASLVAAVRRLQNDPALMARLAAEGRMWIARHHTAESHLRVLRSVFSRFDEGAAAGSTKAKLPGHFKAREL